MENLIECKNIAKIHRGRGIGGAGRASRRWMESPISIERGAAMALWENRDVGKRASRDRYCIWTPQLGFSFFDGTDLGAVEPKGNSGFRKRMQIVFQDPNSALNPKMSIHDSMSEGLINRGVVEKSGNPGIKELLELVGISYSYRNRYPHEFSGGQKQSVSSSPGR